MFLKKAAMFGLDARIALVIFGALSVISGAALYSAIGNAKATAILAELNELGKAYEQYWLDTGITLPRRSANSAIMEYNSLSTANLVVNKVSTAGWKGPYLSYKEDAGGEYLNHPTYSNVLIEQLNDTDWSSDWPNALCDTAGQTCYIGVSIDGINDLNVAANIDEMVDGGDGAGAGMFRWLPAMPAARYILFTMPYKNPKG